MRSGERVALADLYDRHAGLLVGLAGYLLRDQRDAEDLVHDVFLEAWQRSSEYDARRGSVRTWLSLRTRSRAIDRLRSLARARHHGLLGGGESPVGRFPPPDQDVDRAHVARAIAGLTPGQREVVDLCYFHGLSCTEVAERVDVPHGTVKSRLAAAMTALRKELAAGPENR
jgi:RNA polymerase sigma-70 factor (ECF subfamily)